MLMSTCTRARSEYWEWVPPSLVQPGLVPECMAAAGHQDVQLTGPITGMRAGLRGSEGEQGQTLSGKSTRRALHQYHTPCHPL